ncbi:MAG: hypothetical protein ACKOYK_10685, partial [Cyanobium sp.]
SIPKPVIRASTTLASLCSLFFCGSVLTHQGAAHAQTYLPAYTTSGSGGAYATTNVPSSYGFFFDYQSTDPLDGLGFSSQPFWGNNKSYEVKLWNFKNGGANLSDYTVVASTTFTHGISYPFQDGYFWQTLGPIPMVDTFTNDLANLEGYVISAIGDFSNSPGNVQFEGGTASFNSRFVPSDPLNGFNQDGFTLYPIPIFDGGVGQNGYFNANLSTVPGPLPVLGAAAGFGWTRRLRKRIRASK